MSIRDTEEYKNMGSYLAVSTIENFDGDNITEADLLASWQYISDIGLWRHLQGTYGRTVMTLLDEGIIEFPLKHV